MLRKRRQATTYYVCYRYLFVTVLAGTILSVNSSSSCRSTTGGSYEPVVTRSTGTPPQQRVVIPSRPTGSSGWIQTNTNIHASKRCKTTFRKRLVRCTPTTTTTKSSMVLAYYDVTNIGSSFISSVADVTLTEKEELLVVPIPFILLVAIGLGITANIWIQTMIGVDSTDDRGIGSFLRDGSGYNRSGFRPITPNDNNNKKKNNNKNNNTTNNNNNTNNNVAVGGLDPLPWLKLPKLDFVEVAGQLDVAATTSSSSSIVDGNNNSIFIVADDSQEEQQTTTMIMMELDRLRLQMYQKIQQKRYDEATTIRMELEQRMKQYGIEYIPEK